MAGFALWTSSLGVQLCMAGEKSTFNRRTGKWPQNKGISNVRIRAVASYTMRTIYSSDARVRQFSPKAELE